MSIITVVTNSFSYGASEFSGGPAYLLGVALEHQVLLALIQSTFLQSPEMKNSVLPLEQLAENTCTHGHTWIVNTVQHTYKTS